MGERGRDRVLGSERVGERVWEGESIGRESVWKRERGRERECGRDSVGECGRDSVGESVGERGRGREWERE